ncbi:hypothetical protein H2248_004129 [Termitomyces sp. 'cryptogamus']|nr:hypothetical protein H2248_004129 [Termitomyces sp. 'cryptogamus']
MYQHEKQSTRVKKMVNARVQKSNTDKHQPPPHLRAAAPHARHRSITVNKGTSEFIGCRCISLVGRTTRSSMECGHLKTVLPTWGIKRLDTVSQAERVSGCPTRRRKIVDTASIVDQKPGAGPNTNQPVMKMSVTDVDRQALVNNGTTNATAGLDGVAGDVKVFSDWDARWG